MKESTFSLGLPTSREQRGMNPQRFKKTFKALFNLASIALVSIVAGNDSQEWISLFNGKDLSGWTVKISGHPIGKNFGDTFRVEDGLLKTGYDKYESFDMQFGHLYTNISYSNYIIRVDFKILKFEPLPDAPHWTAYNSGIMLHSQSPSSLALDQNFPVSLEGQFLSEETTAGTQNANVVTPGTHIEYGGKLNTAHIINSTAPLPQIGEWVSFEAEVRGHEEIIYRVNGVEALRYAHPILDGSDPDAKRLIDRGASLQLSHGHIALQAEGHPIWFRNIEILPLSN